MENEELEKKADELLDEKQERDAGEENAENPDAKNSKKLSPEEQLQELRKLCSGTLRLMAPFRAHGQDVKEVPFDFCALSGMDMVNALDEALTNNLFAISNSQAMALFAAAVEKCAPTVSENGMTTKLYDAKDIKKRFSAPDISYALRIAKLFYSASSQAGSNNFSRE